MRVLPEALRDKFVCGVRNSAIQKRLLTEATLTMESVLKIATGMETVDRDMKAIKNPAPISLVMNLPARPNPAKRPCYRCGRNRVSVKPGPWTCGLDSGLDCGLDSGLM